MDHRFSGLNIWYSSVYFFGQALVVSGQRTVKAIQNPACVWQISSFWYYSLFMRPFGWYYMFDFVKSANNRC